MMHSLTHIWTSPNAVVACLEREYEALTARTSELDERDFLTMDAARFASPRMSPCSMYKPLSPLPHQHQHVACVGAYGGAVVLGGPAAPTGQRLGPGSFSSAPLESSLGSLQHLMSPGKAGGFMPAMPTAQQLLSPGKATVVAPMTLHSPLPMMTMGGSMSAAATPITEALGSAAWLRNITSQLAPEPTPSLQAIFAACSPNPGPVIARRVAEMAEVVLPNEQPSSTAFPLLQPSLSAERRVEVNVAVCVCVCAVHLAWMAEMVVMQPTLSEERLLRCV